MAAMTSNRILRYIGWSAVVGAAISFISGIFLLLFFMNIPVPGPLVTVGTSPLDFGLLNDLGSVVANAFLLPLPLGLYWLTHRKLTHRRQQVLNGIALALGSLGVLALLIGQALLVTGVMSFDVNLSFAMLGLALLGAWLLLANYLGRVGGVLVRWQTWLGWLTGVGFVLAVAFLVLGKPFEVLEAGTLALQPPAFMRMLIVLAIVGALTYLVTFPIWLFGLGHRLLAAPVVPAEHDLRVRQRMQQEETAMSEHPS